MRITKFILMLVGLIVMIYAYNLDKSTLIYYSNRSNLFDRLTTYFMCTVTGLVLWEYWEDNLLRLVSLTCFLGCLNAFLDEVFFNPFVFDINEQISGAVILLAFIYNLLMLMIDVLRPRINKY